ncbi:hypothetical protein SCLCIDRAFT_30208 [Scleroderma citrinum Foug A]|uniref:non-specific serine/threonine protein kinase n=1 Tax=Scleroderma citrinum Foug A TaxID=1036808 RepID=A0A0C3DHY8_9AGAM|nr:hypothetical protein SCLCIDRAFT_30208 [Scleroderma citrinum Foug A]
MSDAVPSPHTPQPPPHSHQPSSNISISLPPPTPATSSGPGALLNTEAREIVPDVTWQCKTIVIRRADSTENIHSRSFIHRDIKPSNILIGTSQQASTIYLIDFSIATLYRDPSTHRHNTFKEYCGSLGSPAFSSINSNLGFELGRRDDIEALVYVLLYFTCGSLPWLGHTPCLEHDAIASMKQDILQHDDIPKALVTMLSYTRSLSFTQKPDYN